MPAIARERLPPAPRGDREGAPRSCWVVAVAALTVVARLPFAIRPLSPDEGGFLLVASQWSPGRSLYGDYWVDRPPLLIDLFWLADRLGGTLGLRVMGMAATVAAVLLAADVGRRVAGPRAPSAVQARVALLGAVTAAVFLSEPMFGAMEVNGELLAVPLVLAAVTLMLRALETGPSPLRGALLVASGAAAAGAAMVKQSELDGLVFVFVAALTVGRRAGAPFPRTLVPLAAGALALSTAVVSHAALLGTAPGALWDAVVTFRLEATRVISASAPSSTTDRLHRMLVVLVVSGAVALLVPLAGRMRHRPATAPDLRWAIAALLGWELFMVLGGGSYWLHYLIALVPGLVLVVAYVSATPELGRRAIRWSVATLAYAAAATCVALAITRAYMPPPAPVITWLSAHSQPGDTAVVAFGHPNYLRSSGLTSPYPGIWSLPVRVRDPELHDLAAVLASPSRPDWVVTGPSGDLSGWGIDARTANAALRLHYRQVADLGDRIVFAERDGAGT